jgi:hypothetical protein
MLTGKLGPVAFARCVGKHVAGVVAGIAKGLCRSASLPLEPLPVEPPPNEPTAGRASTTEEPAPCCRPQPV